MDIDCREAEECVQGDEETIIMRTKEQMCKWVASLLILLALFCFLSIGIANAGSYTYTLSGGPSSVAPLVVDDDLEVRVNEKIVFIDNDHVSTHDGRAIWKGEPITFSASPGDVLRIIATNPGSVDIELSPLYLHVNGQSLKLSDGVPNTRSEKYEFFNESFTISIPAPLVSILDYSPSPVHGEDDFYVKVSWSNIPVGWKLVVSLEESDLNFTRLADDVSKTVSGSGEATFTLKVYPTTEPHSEAKVCACLYNEKGEWTGVFDKKNITINPKPDIPRKYLYLGAIALALILLPLIIYRKGKKRPKPTEEPVKKGKAEETKIPETEIAKSKVWVNVDKPTKTCTIHADEGCTYVKDRQETPFKGVGELKRDGGWISFNSVDEARNWCQSKYTRYEIKSCKLCDTGVSPEAVKAELKKTFSEKDAARLANTFRIVQEIRSSYCNTDTKAREINKEFDLLKMYFTEKEFLAEIENIQRRINAELRENERLDEKHVEAVKYFCEKFTEMWIARFLR